MVRHEDEGPVVRDQVDALKIKASIREQLRPNHQLADVEGLYAADRRDPRRHVEMQDRPAPEDSSGVQPHVGIDRPRVPYRAQQR